MQHMCLSVLPLTSIPRGTLHQEHNLCGNSWIAAAFAVVTDVNVTTHVAAALESAEYELLEAVTKISTSFIGLLVESNKVCLTTHNLSYWSVEFLLHSHSDQVYACLCLHMHLNIFGDI